MLLAETLHQIRVVVHLVSDRVWIHQLQRTFSCILLEWTALYCWHVLQETFHSMMLYMYMICLSTMIICMYNVYMCRYIYYIYTYIHTMYKCIHNVMYYILCGVCNIISYKTWNQNRGGGLWHSAHRVFPILVGRSWIPRWGAFFPLSSMGLAYLHYLPTFGWFLTVKYDKCR